MMLQTYLKSFGQMVQLLEENGVKVDHLLALTAQAAPSRMICNGQTVEVGHDLFEKLVGTWWEVELNDIRKTPSQCAYLADSLQDALRLRPEIDTSYWCSDADTIQTFLDEIEDWVDDECFVE